MEYIVTIGWMAVAAIAGHVAGMHHRENVLGKEERRATWVYALFVVLPIIFLTGMRNLYFGDTLTYLSNFKSIPSSMSGKWEYIQSITKDKGFYAFAAFLTIFIGSHQRVYLMILAFIQMFCVTKTYRKYSCDFWFSIFVFIASTDILSWMHNGLRQFMAVAVIFASSGWLFKKKYIRFIIAVLVASTFHQSALLMIPIAFIVQGRAWNWKTLVVVMLTVLAIAFVGQFTNLLDSMLVDTQYRNVVSDWQSWNDDGTNPLRVLVYSVPTIIAFIGRKKIAKCGDRVIHICCNMSIISTALYLVSIVTSGIFIGRLPIYCSLYATGILLPWEFRNVFGKGLGRQIRGLAIVCFVLFYFLQLMLWGLV